MNITQLVQEKDERIDEIISLFNADIGQDSRYALCEEYDKLRGEIEFLEDELYE